MANSTQFRQFHIAQDADGHHIEVVRDAEQVAVLAFDAARQAFVVCHVLLKMPKQREEFDSRIEKLRGTGQQRLARVLDSGDDEGNVFYITEMVDGETLQEYLERFETVPLWLAVSLAKGAFEAARLLARVGDLMSRAPLEAMRVLQTGPMTLELRMGDFALNDGDGAKAALARQARMEFASRSRQLSGWCSQQWQQRGGGGAEVAVGEFSRRLHEALIGCGPGGEGVMEETVEVFSRLLTDWSANGELPPMLKPRMLLTPFLLPAQEMAARLGAQVKIQSQRLEFSGPYAVTGTLAKNGQTVIVEQFPPEDLTGPGMREALRQAHDIPKAGKFPNLVPVTLLEGEDGLECVAEPVVDGVSLREVLSARGVLNVQETHLVLAGVDAALAQLEKARAGTLRLRLEDVFLFTGSSSEAPVETELLQKKLTEWPGFSVVVKTRRSLEAMSGRGWDPSVLLPLNIAVAEGVEPVWHGGWMAALGSCLLGAGGPLGASRETGVADMDTILRLLDDELGRTARGEASTRAAFLARYARVMQQFDLIQFSKSGGFWPEVSGGVAPPTSPRTAEPVETTPQAAGTKLVVMKKSARPAASSVPAARGGEAEEDEMLPIGFAEALIRQGGRPAPGGHEDHPGLGGLDEDHDGEVESSWVNMREERPFWARLMLLALGSLVAGAVLAHLSGRALWQSQLAPVEIPAPKPVEQKVEPVFELQAPPGHEEAAAERKVVPKEAAAAPRQSLQLPPPSRMKAEEVAPPAAAPSVAAPPPAAMKTTPKPPPLAEAVVDGPGAMNAVVPVPKRTAAQLESAARSGDAGAMHELGGAWLKGDFGRVDEVTGAAWLVQAVNGGNLEAMATLADCYLQGRGVEKSALRAVQLLQAAADKGVPAAKDKLGVCLATGTGIAMDETKAFALLQEAYDAGVPSARGNLGVMYLRGRGVAPDAAKAVELFVEGARLGHAESMLNYAQCLEYGNGTRVNLQEATRWYREAAKLGIAEAVRWCAEKRVAY